MRGRIEYSANNSGGHWWLDDAAWQRLEDAGWVVHWVHDPNDPSHQHPEREHEFMLSLPHTHAYDETHALTRVKPNGERYLGALARSAAKLADDPGMAVSEWQDATGLDASAQGCNCCGAPHSFTFIDAEGTAHYTTVEVERTSLRWSS